MSAAGTDAQFAADGGGVCPAWQAPPGVCPAVHARLQRRRAAANAVVRAATGRLRTLVGALVRLIRAVARR
jgi:hypothetical protein